MIDLQPAAKKLLKVIQYTSTSACNTMMCSCMKYDLACSLAFSDSMDICANMTSLSEETDSEADYDTQKQWGLCQLQTKETLKPH